MIEVNKMKKQFDEIIFKANSRLQLLRLEYFDKVCKKCLNTQQQKSRNCSLLRGLISIGCQHQDNWIMRKSRKDNEKDLQVLFADLENIKSDISGGKQDGNI